MKAGIIGGGLGGMMSALQLARAGWEVDLFERSSQLGGRLAFESNGGMYQIDRGPTIVLLPEMLQSLLAEVGIGSEEYELIECDPLYRIHYPDGMCLTKYRDPDRMAEELERLFPGDGQGMRRYMEDMAPAFTEGKTKFLDRSFLRKRDFFSIDNLKLLGRLRAYQSTRQLAARYFKAERAIDAFSLQTLYIGGLPGASPSLYSFIPYAEHEFGIWYWKGGYASLVPLLEKHLIAQGVQIHQGDNGDVTGIQIEDSMAKGFHTRNNGFHSYDHVIYNGDFPNLSKLLPAGKAKPRSFKPSSGCILLYIGAEKRWSDDGGPIGEPPTDRSVIPHQYFLPQSLNHSLEQMAARLKPPGDSDELPPYYIFNPVAADPEAAPAGHSVLYVLIPLPVPYLEEDVGARERLRESASMLAERIIADAEERAFPGLKASIRWMNIRTPADGAAEGWYQGGSFGIAPTLSQSGPFRPQIVPYPIKGLYSVGASIHPGGGVPIVLQGAKLLTDHLTKERVSWTGA
ncbi:phytoene desaturase family protein [Paenibacillus daejeonensis]|uniref:phytoene desaturase family protein n=1 Tax=Paenibacillus daejeonensis TaxID=135193 RepID=UPI00037CBCBA|nr:phytoene desaturase family protein [Paenibacillus daejeonensis]